MEQVIVSGVSRKGKNRIHENGEVWLLIDQKPDKILIQSKKNSNCIRWVDLKNDQDMVIISRNEV